MEDSARIVGKRRVVNMMVELEPEYCLSVQLASQAKTDLDFCLNLLNNPPVAETLCLNLEPMLQSILIRRIIEGV